MKYFIDTEFNGFGGKLLSIAIVREDGESRYFMFGIAEDEIVPWVKEHVLPYMRAAPLTQDHPVTEYVAMREIVSFLRGDPSPTIIADWPDDIRYFCELLITGPGKMFGVQNLKFEMVRVKSYPTTLTDAVQHNAWWDAMALRQKMML